MPDESQIRINALLLEREALFVRVHEIERAAAVVFGEPFPFERPVLPSDFRSKRPRPKRKAVAGELTKLRKLSEESGEVAYRVTYRQHGQQRSETHDAPEALNTLLTAQGAQLQVISIETLDAEGDVITTLFGDTAPNTL